MPTFESKLEASNYRPTGFDYLRIFLALSVVFWHEIITCFGINAQVNAISDPITRPIFGAILPMFFALSGFLVAGSLERTTNLGQFLWLRAIRIFPALVFEIVLSALLLGVLLTQLPLVEYFSSPQFFKYFQNCLGIINYELPGVFINNPHPNVVNGQLWTVPFELDCYISLTLFAFVLAAIKSKSGSVFMLVAVIIINLYGPIFVIQNHISLMESCVMGQELVICFLFGVCLFKLRAIIPYNANLAIISGLAFILLMQSNVGTTLIPLPAAYLTAYLGLKTPKVWKFLKTGDYSYGIFLFGFPIQQAIASFGFVGPKWPLHLALSLIFITIWAVISWHLVEKHALKLKNLPSNLIARFGTKVAAE